MAMLVLRARGAWARSGAAVHMSGGHGCVPRAARLKASKRAALAHRMGAVGLAQGAEARAARSTVVAHRRQRLRSYSAAASSELKLRCATPGRSWGTASCGAGGNGGGKRRGWQKAEGACGAAAWDWQA